MLRSVCLPACAVDNSGKQLPPQSVPLYKGSTYLTGGFNLLIDDTNIMVGNPLWRACSLHRDGTVAHAPQRKARVAASLQSLRSGGSFVGDSVG